MRLTSPALVGGPRMLVTNKQGQLRFVALPPGTYVLDITLPGFAPVHVDDIRIGAGATIARTVKLKLAGAESIVVEAGGSRTDVQDPGFATHVGRDGIQGTPGRNLSMFDALRSAPGISPTSPSSGTVTTMSAAGSGTNENQSRLDGTNHTCTCNGTARVEPASGFIQEVQVQTVGASAEFGYVQGAVVNVITRQGTDRLLFDGTYYGQPSGLTSRPVLLQSSAPVGIGATGYTRVAYRDLTMTSGGPFIPTRAWFFLGYQHIRDADSQPGADSSHPREYKEDKTLLKLNWRLAPGWQLDQSVHYEHGINPDRPTYVTPYQAVSVPHLSVPAMTFAI